jgi:hypothetical protein
VLSRARPRWRRSPRAGGGSRLGRPGLATPAASPPRAPPVAPSMSPAPVASPPPLVKRRLRRPLGRSRTIPRGTRPAGYHTCPGNAHTDPRVDIAPLPRGTQPRSVPPSRNSPLSGALVRRAKYSAPANRGPFVSAAHTQPEAGNGHRHPGVDFSDARRLDNPAFLHERCNTRPRSEPTGAFLSTRNAERL